MDIETYEREGRALYAGLAEVVATILVAAVRQSESMRLQQIQHRAKEPASLRTKLEKAKAPSDGDIEPFAKDLAGARLIFYTNSDVGRFLNSGIITENFEVDWDRTKIHHPTTEDAQASELFVSNNYVVRLKDERAALPEYAAYAGLWCEVQVQTTLNHAWAEMAHDTIYKKPVLAGFGGNLMLGIENRMKAIMRDYLAPAGYAFQKVLSDYERLSRGQALFEQGIVSALAEAQDSNTLHEILQKFSSSVLPYLDDYETTAAELLPAVIDGVQRSRGWQPRNVDTPFGALRGKTSQDIARAAAAILKELRFVDVEATFGALIELFREAGGEERKLWVELAGELAKHHLQVWRQAGPIVQVILMERILALSAEDKVAVMPLIWAVLEEVFSTDLSGATSNYDSITLHRGAVPASDTLRQLRRDALALLYACEDQVLDDDRQAELIALYFKAMSLPHLSSRSPDPDLAAMVFEDSAQIIARFSEQVEGWTYEQRQKVEHDLLWKYRHYGAAPPAELTNAAADAAREQLVAAILGFRDRVNIDDGFTTYKLLVGFESVFPPAWDNREFDYEDEERYRAERIESLVAEIEPADAGKWLAIIRRCAQTRSNDLATFPTFSKFLEHLAASKPQLVLAYLDDLDDRLANFLSPMLGGLNATPSWPAAAAICERWVAEGRYLGDLAWACRWVTALSSDFMGKVFSAAAAAEDTDAVFALIRTISGRDGDGLSVEELKPLFVACVDFMSSRGEARWVNAWWSRKAGEDGLIGGLSEEEARAVLTSLVRYSGWETHLEWFLAQMAERRPSLVLDFVGQRLALRSSDDRPEDYDATPYRLHRLDRVLSQQAALVLKSARQWFAEDSERFRYGGARFIHAVYPSFSDALASELGQVLSSGDREDVAFVIALLSAYSGEAFLQPTLMGAVAQLEANDALLDHIEVALEPSGITQGEFGRVLRLKAHKGAIEAWLSDPRERVRAFAERYLRQVDRSIAAEQRRSEESVALRRLEYEQVEGRAEGE